jgi:hypothetical protein
MPVRNEIFEKNDFRIAPQNFDAGILCALLSVITSFVPLITAPGISIFWRLGYIIVNTFMLIYFRNYLRNFNDRRVIMWMNQLIITNMVFLALDTVSYFNFNAGIEHTSILESRIFLISYIIAIIWANVALIIIGLRLQDIVNDQIGLLKNIGIFYAFINPLITAFIIIMPFIERISESIAKHEKIISIITNTVYSIPLYLIAIVFMRAKQYFKKQSISEESEHITNQQF